MGIGNTTSSAAIMAVCLGLDATECVGAGTGSDAAQIAHKAQVINAAIAKHELNIQSDMHSIICAIGGLEIAAIAGAMLQCAEHQTAFMVDGFIATAALLLAQKSNANITDFAFFGHQSDESGHKTMLKHFAATPLLQLDLRLGEGTGAVLAIS